MKTIALRTVIVLILQTLWLQTAHSADTGSPKLKEEMAKQEQIYHSLGEQTPGGYTVDRSLLIYTQVLPSEFDRALANLGPNDRWLDIGAGKGQAILDYYSADYDVARLDGRERRGKKAQAVAMSIEDRRTPLWQQSAAGLAANQLQYFYSRRLREYSVEELGQFQVITDVIGGFSYTDTLSLFVKKVLDLLTLNGSFYTVLQDVQSEAGTNQPHYPGSPFLTEIKSANGSDVKICSWLKSIACVEVTCELKTAWKPPIETYRIRKVCNDVNVPALVPLHYEAGTPPERRYRLEN